MQMNILILRVISPPHPPEKGENTPSRRNRNLPRILECLLETLFGTIRIIFLLIFINAAEQ